MTVVMRRDLSRLALVGAAGLAVLAGSACSSTDSGEGAGTALKNIFTYGGPTVPPPAQKPPIEASECPSVTILEGGSVVKVGSGQIEISNLARECIQRPDGSVVIKIGVQGRALVGPGGNSGNFSTIVHFDVRRGDTVLASGSKPASVSLPPGRYEGTFSVVQGGLVVPPGTTDFDIEASLGGSRAAPAHVRRRKRG